MSISSGTRISVRLSVLFICLAALAAGGCKPDKAALHNGLSAIPTGTSVEEQAGDSPVVARIGNREIRFAEVTDNLDSLPVFVRMRYQAPERRLEFLEAYIEYQLIALKASSDGFARDPVVVDGLKRDLVRRYVRDSVDMNILTADIPESEIGAWYQAHLYEYSHPEQNHVLRLLVSDPVEAGKVAFRATELVRAATGDPVEVFRGLVSRTSVRSNATVKLEDPGFLPASPDAPSPLPESVVKAAVAMTELYSVAGPIEGPDGWSVLLLVARAPAVDKTIDEARSSIAAILLDQHRLEARRALVERLKAGHTVTVNTDVLAGLAAEAEAAGDSPRPESD